MPETPKSFEEWFENWYDTHSFSTSRQAAWDAWNAALSMPPQAAAVPARQDAAPEKEMEQLCSSCRHPRSEHDDGMCYHQSLGDQECVIECECNEFRSTQPTQAAVGEGGLPEGFYGMAPPLGPYTLGTDAAVRHEQWRIDNTRFIEVRDALERQLRETEAQRDEARKRFGVGPHVLTARTGEQALCGGPDVCPACIHEANLAALDVPKPEPEEIERLAGCVIDKVQMTNEDYVHEEVVELLTSWLSRLRSLPSEPGSGVQRKAVENG